MGRIKSKLIKRTARELMKQEEFSADFSKNKEKLSEILKVNKKQRNQIAGQITRLKKNK